MVVVTATAVVVVSQYNGEHFGSSAAARRVELKQNDILSFEKNNKKFSQHLSTPMIAPPERQLNTSYRVTDPICWLH
jgi:hypothetical protein